MRDVRDGIKHKMHTLDVTMLKELKKLRVSARKEMKKSPFADADATIAAQVGLVGCVIICICCDLVLRTLLDCLID